MSDIKKSWLVLITASVFCFAVGVQIGTELDEESRQREIIELKIELTTLEIKKLKGLCNE